MVGLKKQGLNIELHVYDVDDDMAKAMKVINMDEMRSMDLIIGPFFSRIFPLASNFARIFDIPIVNPLSKRSDIVQNNAQVYKFQPTGRFQIEDVKVATLFVMSALNWSYHWMKRDGPLALCEITKHYTQLILQSLNTQN